MSGSVIITLTSSCSLPITLYLVDTFTYAASALAAASVSLHILSCCLSWTEHLQYTGAQVHVWICFPVRSVQKFQWLKIDRVDFRYRLFGNQMFLALGLGGGNSLLAGLAIVLGIPFPVWIWYHGEDIRARSKYSN